MPVELVTIPSKEVSTRISEMDSQDKILSNLKASQQNLMEMQKIF